MLQNDILNSDFDLKVQRVSCALQIFRQIMNLGHLKKDTSCLTAITHSILSLENGVNITIV